MKKNNVLSLCFLSLTFIAFVFSFFLMFRTFGYNSQKNIIVIAPKLWSDFGAHIPLIRSFSMGSNFTQLLHFEPIESPLYPGEPIRYHFGFYAIVGILEKIGMRLDYALNIPSALGFFLLILMIYLFSYELFKNRLVSFLSVLFFLFNGTLSFLAFLKKIPLSWQSLTDITSASRFATFGPWDGQNISAFWNLNIYTNQRHLGLSYGLVLFILWQLLRHRPHHYSGILIGISGAILLYINFAAAGILGLFAGWMFLIKKTTRIPLIQSLIFVVPALLILYRYTNLSSVIILEPGYLVRHPLTWKTIVEYWYQNFGLHTLLIPAGFLLAPRPIKKLLGIPMLILFLAPNIYRFSSDMINNHKFFNFFIIIGGMFSAYAIYRIAQVATRFHLFTRLLVYSFISLLIFFSTLSGIIDFFPIINDAEGGLIDYKANPDAQYILGHTPPDAVIANSYWFYHPANIVGRPIFSGYTYFTFSYGYDQGKREKQILSIYRADSPNVLCTLLDAYHISYIELVKNPEGYLQPNMNLWNSLPSDYENPDTHLRIFSKQTVCR